MTLWDVVTGQVPGWVKFMEWGVCAVIGTHLARPYRRAEDETTR